MSTKNFKVGCVDDHISDSFKYITAPANWVPAHAAMISTCTDGNVIYFTFDAETGNVIVHESKRETETKNAVEPVCECGKDKHGFAAHSHWCPKGKENL